MHTHGTGGGVSDAARECAGEGGGRQGLAGRHKGRAANFPSANSGGGSGDEEGGRGMEGEDMEGKGRGEANVHMHALAHRGTRAC